MNKSIIRFVLATVAKFTGFFLLIPTLVGIIYHEDVYIYYLITALASIIVGFCFSYKKPTSTVFYLKEGCVATGLSWLVLSFIGAIPLWLTGEIPSFVDAMFETVSGFTTTGASILSDVEALSHASLFWRSFTHLVGGMGVLVFLLAVIPLSGGSNINLMRAESPGPSVGKLMPKIKYTARILYIIYLGLTGLEFVLLLFGDMDAFTAINTAMATAGTGGFGVLNTSIGSFNLYTKWVVTIFMILFGVNFNFYYLILFRQAKIAFKMEEVKVYIAIIAVSIFIICSNTFSLYNNLTQCLTDSAFSVASVITTTGFSTTDFAAWPQTSRMILVLLMFIGACAGSTGGGIKVSRIIIIVKNVGKELTSYIHPRSIKKITMDGKLIEHDVIRSTNVFLATYMLIFIGSTFVVSFENLDFGTTFTSVAATLNNIGPGMNLVGPTCNFGFFTNISKIVFMFDMLAGRLELFPILMLFHPVIVHDTFTKRRHKIQKIVNEKQAEIKEAQEDVQARISEAHEEAQAKINDAHEEAQARINDIKKD